MAPTTVYHYTAAEMPAGGFMSVFTVFAIGTGHSRAEQNTLMVRLYNACDAVDAANTGSPMPQIKYILDGIGASYDATTGKVEKNLFAQAIGLGMSDKAEEVIEHIRRVRPRVVNLTGHSRGAIICVKIAADLAEQMPDIKCNLFLVDPVRSSVLVSPEESAKTYGNVKLFRQIVMENETKFIFDPTRISHGGAATNTVHMPGTHGTATQTGQPVGMVAYMLAVNFLAFNGSAMRDRHYTPQQLCDAYSRINQANPVKRGGGGKGRAFQDMDSGGGWSFSLSGMRDLMGFGRKNEWQNHDYFINNDHAKQFMTIWPELFLALTGKASVSTSAMPRLKDDVRKARIQAPRAFSTLPVELRTLAMS